ncbi:MAG TPA: polysaccharide deacetylase family protein [Gemmatales bacterium]|nr:polysaccharide deacetylase family protein [Gemmatales bacterium]
MPNSTILSFDVEEHHRIEAASGLSCAANRREEYASRAVSTTRRLSQLLAESNTKATFFIVGELAQRHPDLVRELHQAGHEIASHGWDHQPVYRLGREAFRRDITRSKDVLEEITGEPVKGYRAPTFSVMQKTSWAIDELIEAGYQYDSSVFPVHHDRYGVPDAPVSPFRCYGSSRMQSILEIPPLTLQTGLANVPVGGGGYFRLLPLLLLKAGIWLNRGHSPAVSMLYFHPWEFDASQPKLPLRGVSRWRTYVGIERAEARLRRITRYTSITSFQRACDVAESIDALPLPVYHLKPQKVSPVPMLVPA